jgi:alanine racemase
MHKPLRLKCSKDALTANWRWLGARAGTSCGAAIKADGYGLQALYVLEFLAEAGCRDFFVSTWQEAEELGRVTNEVSVAVLHGIGRDDVEAAMALPCRPVLNSAQQVARWKSVAPERLCDVMIDTGMNRLGLRPEEAHLLSGLRIDTLHSHLACADKDHPLNHQQLASFGAAAASIQATRYSLSNSAGVLLGKEYAFDLVRPGLALYGGVPRPEARGNIRQVARLEAQVVQRRTIPRGESCGYDATFVAERPTEAAIVNIGYADGYWRGFSAIGNGRSSGIGLPVLGRVSMDLVALNCSEFPALAEGDWVDLDFELEEGARRSGKSQYELLTGLGQRFDRSWH